MKWKWSRSNENQWALIHQRDKMLRQSRNTAVGYMREFAKQIFRILPTVANFYSIALRAHSRLRSFALISLFWYELSVYWLFDCDLRIAKAEENKESASHKKLPCIFIINLGVRDKLACLTFLMLINEYDCPEDTREKRIKWFISTIFVSEKITICRKLYSWLD